MKWKIYTKTVETDDGGLVTRWFWQKPVTEGRAQSSEGFTSSAGFWRKPVREAADDSAQGFTSQAECEADAAQHGYTPEKIVGELSGSYTCRAQRLAFKYDGSWQMRSGMIHWTATIRSRSSCWEARGTLFENRPTSMTEAVRRSVEQWIEAFSSGQASSR